MPNIDCGHETNLCSSTRGLGYGRFRAYSYETKSDVCDDTEKTLFGCPMLERI